VIDVQFKTELTGSWQIVNISAEMLDVAAARGFSAEAGVARALQRGMPDRMEQAGAAFHARVADAFERFEQPLWQAGHPETGPILPIDADGTADDVERRILTALAEAVPALRGAFAAEHG
jgi:hypothetical protein